MNMKLEFQESAPRFSEEIIELMNTPEDIYYKPNLEIGDTTNVFNGEEIVAMTIERIDGSEYTLTDRCGYLFLAEIWRWSEQLGDILRTKTSMKNAKKAGWKNTCCDECIRYELMQEKLAEEQNQNLEEQQQ